MSDDPTSETPVSRVRLAAIDERTRRTEDEVRDIAVALGKVAQSMSDRLDWDKAAQAERSATWRRTLETLGQVWSALATPLLIVAVLVYMWAGGDAEDIAVVVEAATP